MSKPLSPAVFAILRLLLEESVGFHYRPEDMSIFADKLSTRMRDAGFESPLDYYYRLRYDDPQRSELAALADVLIVGETYFFRELGPLRAAIRHVVEPAIAARGRARIWSAGCSTGEEPLSIAMLLSDAGLADKCEILATDLGTRSIERAHAGIYGARSLRAVESDPMLAATAWRWLARDGEGARARPELLRRVVYRRQNLLDAPPALDREAFDLVLCRNVLIYFSDETIARVARDLASALRPGGTLLVGASESLLRFGTQYRCVERDGTFLYEKDPR